MMRPFNTMNCFHGSVTVVYFKSVPHILPCCYKYSLAYQMQINWSVKIVPNKRRNTFQRPAVSADHLTISLFLELFYTLSVQLSVTVQKLCEASRKGNNSGDLLYEARSTRTQVLL